MNLRGATLEEVTFEDCRLREVDLGGARLTGVSVRRLPDRAARPHRPTLDRGRPARRQPSTSPAAWTGSAAPILDVGQVLDLAPALAVQLGVDVRQPE